uniref:Fibronectin type-III domain-containing protein n=1 Tax=Anopheles christyi TaxID=43041 RepID=A0A182K2C0_9DIPT
MMDVDQPVASTNDKEQSARDAEKAQEITAEKSRCEIAGPENDDLPALLISDSDEDDPAKAPIDQKNNKNDDKPEPTKVDVTPGDISGITPIETTVVCADSKGKEDAAEKEATMDETDVVSKDLQEQEDEDLTLVENIDLTGVSSAEESGVSEPSCERSAKQQRKTPPTPAKSSSEMTAQELLESLLGAQEEAFAAHRATDTNPSDLIEFNNQTSVDQRKEDKCENDGTIVVLDDTSICIPESKPNEEKKDITSGTAASGMESMSTSVLLDSEKVEQAAISSDTEKCLESNTADSKNESTTQGANVSGVDCSNVATVVDDVCMLEEMPNVSKSHLRTDEDDDRIASNRSPCISEETECSTKVSDDVEQRKASNRIENGDHAKITDTNDGEAFETNEPPRKKARSISVNSDLPTKPVDDSSSHRSENEDQERLSLDADDASKPDNSIERSEEQLNVPVKFNTDLLEAQVKSAAIDSLKIMSETHKAACSGTVNEKHANKQRIAEGGEKCVNALKPTVCPDVMVIDDDDDENTVADSNDSKVRNMSSSDKNVAEEKKPAVEKQNSDAAVKKSEIESKIRLSPIPPELKSSVPMKMEFVRRFCKPLTEMTRSDLEQLVLQKISEALVHKSDNAALRAIIKKQALKLQGFERSLADMNSHYEALKLVADRAVEDMKKRAKTFIAPVKITRAVGLQVSRCGSTADMASGNKPTHALSANSAKRKVEPVTVSMATGSLNGVREQSVREGPSDMAKKSGSQTVAVAQRNIAPTTPRHQVPNNAPQMITARTSPNTSSTTNGVGRSFKPYVAKFGNSVTAVAGSNPPTTPIRASMNAYDSPSVSSANNTPVHVSPSAASTDSSTNSIAGGGESPVRKKQLHKITPMRPPLSAYQQAQQEKQARQQQEMLLQQIHEQSQQAQRKAQTNTPNPQPSSTVVSSSVDDSLIDLTEEDETQGSEGIAVSSNAAKRPRPSLNGPQTFALAQTTAAIPTSHIATNQLMRIQSRISKADGGGATTMASNSSVAGVFQHNGVVVRPVLNVKRINAPPLQPIRQPVYTNIMPRPPVLSTDQAMGKKRLVVKPSIQALIVPLPSPGPQPENDPSWKLPPPQPTICVNNVQTGIVISWLMPTLNDKHSEIENYQIYAYQELSVPNAVEEWRHVGDVKALLLPMAVTLTQFQEGQRYYFAVRAIDKHKRVGMFSDPRTWSDCNAPNA